MKTNHLYPIIAGLLLTCSASTFAFPSYDPFADATGASGSPYTVGQQLGAVPAASIAGQTNAWGDTWSAINTSAATPTGTLGVSVFSGSLVPTYASFPSGFMTSAGNSVMTTNVNGYSARLNLGRTFTNAPGSNVVYASFLIRADNIAALSSSGVGAFNASFHQSTGVSSVGAASGNFPGELRFIANSTHTTYQVGISKDAPGAGQVAFDTTPRNPGDVVFVIMAYQYVDNTSDIASLWVNPDPSSFGATTAPVAAQSENYSVNNANDFSINSFQILSRNTTQPNRMIFDEVRVGSTWAFVTGGPEITSQPTSLTKGAGTTANFSVAARNGSGNALTFQWFKGATQLSNGGNLSGTTSSNLTVSAVSTSDADSYTCVVGNTIGNITSSAGTLSITDPSITTQPIASQSVAPGSTVNMSIVAVGAAPLTYKWRLNNTELVEDGIHVINSGTAALTIANVQVADSGTYTCVVTNGVLNTATSASSVLSIANPIVTSQPAPVATNFDSTATFSVTVAGTSPFHYQWQKNGVNLTEGGATGNGGTATGATVNSASTNATLTLTHVAFSDAASYSCVVTNDQADSQPHSTTSSSAALTVQDPVFTGQPSSQTVNQGQSATFTITAAGTPTIAYQWLRGATALSNGSGASVTNGATSASLQISGVTSANSGNYRCVITGADGKSYTNAAVSLTVITPVTVITGPTNRFLRVGDHTALAVSVSGTSPITYQWDRNGVNIGGATSSFLSLSSLQIADSGTYTVTMTNAFSPSPVTASAIVDVTSSLRHLTVGNLVVSRLGDGGQTLQVTNGNTIYIDQFGTNGNYVSSVMIPDDTSVNTGALIVAGQDASGGAAGLGEGVLTASPNNTYISLAGYNVTRPYANISGATISGDNASVEPRGIGLVNGLGYYQMALKITASAITGSLRAAYTDDSGTNFWLVGGSLGVRYFNSGSTGSGVSITGSSANNNRFVDVFGGNMYFDSATNTGGIFKMTGSPTVATANSQILTYPVQNQVNEFSVSTDGLTMYLTSGAIGDSAGTGVERWDFNGSIWVSNKVFTYSSGLGARGLVVDWNGFSAGGASGTGATLYFTTAETNNNKLVKVVDVASPTTTLLANAGPSQIFRSVKFAPTASSPSITADPQNTVATNGGTVTMSAGISGTAPLTVAWLKNGTPIGDGPTGNGSTYSGSTTTTLTITGAIAADSGSYSIANLSNDLGSAGPSGSGVLTVLNPGTTTHTNFGDSVTFTAVSGSPSGLTFQWKKAGNNLSNGTTTNGSVVVGATSASLTIQNVNYGDGSGDSQTARTYSCTVTATSSGSSAFQTDGLSVSDPIFVSGSGNQNVGIGGTATFSVVAAGSPPIGYTWRKNGTNISDGPTGTGATYAGTTTTTLTILNAQVGDDAEYEVKLGSCCGQTGNPSAVIGTLSVSDPFITGQPQNTTVECGSSAVLNVAASGTPTFTYQWYTPNTSGTAVPGGTTSSLTVNNVHGVTPYVVVVSGPGGSVTSSSATVTAVDTTAPVITVTPGASTACVNSSYSDPGATASDVCAGSVGVSTSGSVNTSVAGNYTLTYTATDSSLNSSTATRVVSVTTCITSDPEITSQAANVVAATGSNVVFSIAAVGTGQLKYQWFFIKNGTTTPKKMVHSAVIPAVTNDTLSINKVSSAANGGSYYCVVSNALLSVTSSNATLTVHDAPVVKIIPPFKTLLAGYNFKMVAKVTKGALGQTVTYQWQKAGSAISDATNSTYSLVNVQTNDGAIYTCVVNNDSPTAGSNSCPLTVTQDIDVPKVVLLLKPSDGSAKPAYKPGDAIVKDATGTNVAPTVDFIGEAVDKGLIVSALVSNAANQATFPVTFVQKPTSLLATNPSAGKPAFFLSQVTLVGGTNIFYGIATDSDGNTTVSAHATHLFYNSDPQTLTLTTAGTGHVLSVLDATSKNWGNPTNTAVLTYGHNYTIKATATGHLVTFGQWVLNDPSAVVSTNATSATINSLTFQMKTNLSITAKFSNAP